MNQEDIRMIERMTEKTRANLSKEGRVLKKIRIYGGIPMAIMAGGVAMLVCMVFLCGLLIIMGAPEAGYAFGILLGCVWKFIPAFCAPHFAADLVPIRST